MAFQRGEEATPPPLVSSDPLEQRFLIDGRRISELNLEAMSLSELEQVTRQIGEYQVQVQDDFFKTWPTDSLRMISAAEYEEQQLYMHEEMLFLLTRKDGFLTTDLAMVIPNDFPELAFLRSMLQRVRATDVYAAKEREEYQAWVREKEQQFPECRRIENAGRTVVKFVHPDGTVRASRRVMTVGNF